MVATGCTTTSQSYGDVRKAAGSVSHILATVRTVGESSSSIPNNSTSEVACLPIFTFNIAAAKAFGIPHTKRLPKNTASDESLAQARRWLEDCLVGRCTTLQRQENTKQGNIQHLPASHERPSRLIEMISETKLRLINGQSTSSPYVALSYTWGKETPLWQTTRSNVSARQEQFDLSELPKTLRDTVAVTETLDLKHLWIDSVCIIQDSAEDWSQEANRMEGVYRNAHVTVAADHSVGSTSDLFNLSSSDFSDKDLQRSLSQGLQILEIYAQISSSEDQTEQRVPILIVPNNRASYSNYRDLPWTANVGTSNLSTRAWCYQESLLSPRILHFASTQLFWECLHCVRSESYSHTDQGNETIELKRAIFGLESYHPEPYWSNDEFTEPVKLWNNTIVVGNYSERQLSRSSDKLVALAGIAKAFQSRYGMEYHAGLWSEHLVESLCWERAGEEGTKATPYRAPSWSWASQDSMLDFPFDFIYAQVSARVKSVHTETHGGQEFGEVHGGSLDLEAFAAQCVPRNLSVSDQTGETEVKLLNNDYVLSAVLDSELSKAEDSGDEPSDGNSDTSTGLVACLMYTYPLGRILRFLLVKETTPHSFVRVGMASLNPDATHPAFEEILADFTRLPRRTLTIL
ncbi:hypothetical protein LTR10_004554 [Elasticomyces elasticus]|nr:hypothetical protein LTR10_004554 [Elasticomyces elasticus]KAK4976874.1 hypothetical protein LTR42_002919 [Elasticomyces elasticus]